jgi:site-specific recombinase XerD
MSKHHTSSGNELNPDPKTYRIGPPQKTPTTRKSFKEIRGANAGIQVRLRVERRFPHNLKKQLATFLAEFVIKSGTGRLRPVSEATLSKYGDTMFRAVDELKDENAAIRNLGELNKVHVERLIQRWTKEGQSAGTIQNKVSILRRFLAFIGKPHAIPQGAEFKNWLEAKDIQVPNARTIVARESKTWEDKQVDFFEVLDLVRQECAVTAMQLEMQLAFGLRMKESIQIMPSVSDRGDVLSVVRGTKGGMPREVSFDDDEATALWQRDVLERAKLIAANNRKGTLSVPGKNLAQSKSYFYYRIRRHGISKDGLGVTAHGLRHQFAARRYREITGFDTPVSGGSPRAIDSEVKAADLQAGREISVQLGHFRSSITKAYVGSFPMMTRTQRQRVEAWVEKTEGNPVFVQSLKAAGITRAWLGGVMASGAPAASREALRLIVTTDSGIPLLANVRERLKSEIVAIFPPGVDMSEHFDASRSGAPNHTVEIFLNTREKGPTA